MIRFSFDTETHLIRPGRQAPRVVCVQSRLDGVDRLEAREEGLDRLEAALHDRDALIVGHRVVFDALATIATRPRLLISWIHAYDQDRVTCTLEREKLLRIAEGTMFVHKRFDLEALVRRYKLPNPFQEGDKTGPGTWRLRYHELDGVPVAAWPEDARRYALADLVVDRVYECQETAPPAWLADQYRQARAAFWLGLTSAHGMLTDAGAVDTFRARIEAEHASVRDLLTLGTPEALEAFRVAWEAAHPGAVLGAPVVPFAGGLVRSIGSKDTKAARARMLAVCRAKGLPVPVTDTGKEKLEAEEITQAQAEEEYTGLDADATAGTGDPILIAYSRFVSIGILRGRVDRLRLAADLRVPIQPSFDTLKETGRTSVRAGDVDPGVPLSAIGDQTQNPHRSPGLRECYQARPGCAIVSVDWSHAELNGLAQCCIDLGLDSQLARTINAGQDPHLWFACAMNGWEYQWAKAGLKGAHGPETAKKIKTARQGAKACLFGFPGGLGVEKFRLYAAKTYQVHFSHEEAADRKAMWFDAFPEMRGYFRHVDGLVSSGAPLVHFRSGRHRGRITYTSAANSYFQGRIADMAKAAGWRLVRAIYLEGLPARSWNFAHDEILAETPLEIAHETATEIVGIMEEAGREWCPDVPVKAEPAVCLSWRKGAEPYYQEGRLAPWEWRPISDDTKAKIRKDLARGEDPRYLSWVYGLTTERVLAA